MALRFGPGSFRLVETHCVLYLRRAAQETAVVSREPLFTVVKLGRWGRLDESERRGIIELSNLGRRRGRRLPPGAESRR
ncbi:MAG: hypothetical protein ACHQ49_00750 [Elusimicrobiota bacterium]